jgi:hypothetical protein
MLITKFMKTTIWFRDVRDRRREAGRGAAAAGGGAAAG